MFCDSYSSEKVLVHVYVHEYHLEGIIGLHYLLVKVLRSERWYRWKVRRGRAVFARHRSYQGIHLLRLRNRMSIVLGRPGNITKDNSI